MPQENPALNGNGHEADPNASDPTYIPAEVFERLAPEDRVLFKERLATLSRERSDMARRLEKFNQQPRPLSEEPRNGNGHAPAAPVDPEDISKWDDSKIEAAIEKFEQWEVAYASNPDDERAKSIMTNIDLRKQINKARMELGRRSGAKGAEERLAPFEASQRGKAEAEQVFGSVFNDLASRLGGAQRVSALMIETKDDVDRRLAVLGKDRHSATSHEIGLAMAAAIEAAAHNRDGSGDMGSRGRPEIAGEGYGGRARAGAPDADAEISALLRQKREPEANRKAMHRFLTDPSFQPPASMLPQTRADY